VNPVVVHVVRPYASEQEYLNAEAWTIDQRSMLLIDAEALPGDTAVLFDIAIADGQKPIRAEGRVVGMVSPNGGRPGGMRVRFKRFGAATKAFIERAVKAKSGGPEPERPSTPEAERPSAPEAERPSAPEAAPSNGGGHPPRLVDGDRSSMPEVRASMTDLEPAFATPATPSTREPSGLRQRLPGPVTAPANREELLQRLRQRRQAG
jgi:hypothetical protein